MTFREKVATFRTIFADPGKKTTLAKELVSRGVFLNIAVLTDDLIHAGTERLAKTMETDGWKREKAATGCIIFGVLAGSAINPRQLGAFALAGLAMWGLSKTYKSDLSDLGAKMMMMVRGGATVLTIFGVLQAFLLDVKYLANTIFGSHVTMALHMMSPSNGIVERVKNFIKPSGDNGNATKSTGEDQ